MDNSGKGGVMNMKKLFGAKSYVLAFFVGIAFFHSIGWAADEYSNTLPTDLKWEGSSNQKRIVHKANNKNVVLYISHYTTGGGHFNSGIKPGPIYDIIVFADGAVHFENKYSPTGLLDARHHLNKTKLKSLLTQLRWVQSLGKMDARFVGSNHEFMAGVTTFVDGKFVRQSFRIDNIELYAQFRHRIEPYVRSHGYRCPVKDSILTGFQVPQGKKFIPLKEVDFCKSVFEFDQVLPNSKE